MADGISAVCVLLIGVLIYFIPALVGQNRRNAGAIFVLNLLLGWTVIGWVVALVWAMTSESPLPVVTMATPVTDARYRCPRCQQPVARDAPGCATCGVVFVGTATPPFGNTTDKKCPDCAEMVKADARNCRFCGFLFYGGTEAG